MQINSFSTSVSSYNQNLTNSQKAAQQIATGKKINSAADDPAVLAIISGMQGQISGSDQAYRNTQDSISLLNTADGAASNSSDVIQSMRTLSVQAANGTLTDTDRSIIQQQMNQYSAQLDSIAQNAQFNTIYTSDGTLGNFVTQVGANSGQTAAMTIGNISAAALGMNVDVATQASASSSIEAADSALQGVSTLQGNIGAVTNGLQASGRNVSQSSTNLKAAASSLGDSDIASQSTLFNQSKIQSYVSMMLLTQQMQNQRQGTISLLA